MKYALQTVGIFFLSFCLVMVAMYVLDSKAKPSHDVNWVHPDALQPNSGREVEL